MPSPPLDQLALAIMLPWEDHPRTREACLLLATALAANAWRHRQPEAGSGTAGNKLGQCVFAK
jgi:hypothetical protein